jgi:Rod binding domain-containing protein
MIGSIDNLLTTGDLGHLTKNAKDDPKQLEKVAAEFESLLMTQLLRSMRESSGGGWFGEGEDQAGSQMVEIAEQQLARALAGAGGLGLGRLAVAGLTAANPVEPPTE